MIVFDFSVALMIRKKKVAHINIEISLDYPVEK